MMPLLDFCMETVWFISSSRLVVQRLRFPAANRVAVTVFPRFTFVAA
jgi:hypothetical protein